MPNRSNKQKKGLGRFLFGLTARSLMLMNAGVLILSYLSLYINPAEAWFMTIFGLLFFLFLLSNLFLLVWAVKRRSRAAFIPLVALLPSLLLIGRDIQFRGPSGEVPSDAIRIVSYNVGKFTMYPEHSRTKSSEECADSVFAFLRRTDADIISLQEIRAPKGVSVKEWLEDNMPGYEIEYFANVDDSGAYGNATLSRFPVVRKGKFDFEHSSNLALYTDLDTGDGEVRIYNCHFESYNISVPRLVKGITKNDEEMLEQAEEKIRSSITKRPQQVDIVLQDIKNSPIESIVTGDFNDTPMSYTYTQLKRGMKDSFVEAGRGMGGTYSVLWPFIRIDYVLYPDKFNAVSHKVEKVRWSDHYPIVTSLIVN
ncbi:MAG: endonuclease/exonuclease/phosphatase family protein [Bacteroidia bacterium]|nr:endonuclease/exonuclease/phosphatase family protein [Bacteroidia bacterium]